MTTFFQKTFTDGPTSGSWSKSTGSLSTGSISGLYSASTCSISRLCTADSACTPSTSGFDTAGTACTRGSVLLILPGLAVFGPSVQRIRQVLAEFRPPALHTLSSQSNKCTRHSEYVYSECEVDWERMKYVQISFNGKGRGWGYGLGCVESREREAASTASIRSVAAWVLFLNDFADDGELRRRW